MRESHDFDFSIPELGLLQAQFEHAVELEATPQAPARRRLRDRRRALAGALAVALAVAGALLLFGVGTKQVKVFDVQKALAEVARIAERMVLPRPQQFVFTESQSSQLIEQQSEIDPMGYPVQPFFVMRPVNRSTWLSLRNDGRVKESQGDLSYPTAADAANGRQYAEAAKRLESLYRPGGDRGELRAVNRRKQAYAKRTGESGFGMLVTASPNFGLGVFQAQNGYVIGGEMLTAKQVAAYPTDPKAIYRRIHDYVQAGNAKFVARQRRQKNPVPETIDPNVAVWQFVTNPLISANPPLPPKLRAGLVNALGEIPGATAVGSRRDPLGRSGTAFTLDRGGMHQEVIFDPQTSAMLSSMSVLSEPRAARHVPYRRLPKGTVLSEYLLRKQAVVNKAPRIPRIVVR